MKKRRSIGCIGGLLAVSAVCLASWSASAQTESRKSGPPPPQESAPPNGKDGHLCIDCNWGAAFDPRYHLRFYNVWTSNEKEYVDRLRWAVWNQDVWHQFQSTAHFDNCDFHGSVQYIHRLLDEVKNHAEGATATQSDPARHNAKLAAYFAMGQALHAIQDFYAHSNFVELQLKKLVEKPISQSEFMDALVPWWYPGSESIIDDLVAKGLVSGHVWWGSPQRCAAGTLTHAQLAKDSNEKNGGTAAAFGMTLHQVAYEMASRATQRFLEYVWEEWPVLRIGPPGKFVPMSLPIGADRRDHTHEKSN